MFVNIAEVRFFYETNLKIETKKRKGKKSESMFQNQSTRTDKHGLNCTVDKVHLELVFCNDDDDDAVVS